MIKIYQEPIVQVVAQTTFLPMTDWHSNELDTFNTNLDSLSEVAGRVCYMSFGKGRKTNREYLANILAQQHESVLEHGSVSFRLEGISRACSHEIVRHRHLSFSQLSQRYVASNIEFVAHPSLPYDRLDDFKDYCYAVMSEYKHWISESGNPDELTKQDKELARMVLPNCVATKMIVTGNIRAWRHFCLVRGGVGADAEIRKVACAIFSHLKFMAPHCMMDMENVNGYITKVSQG